MYFVNQLSLTSFTPKDLLVCCLTITFHYGMNTFYQFVFDEHRVGKSDVTTIIFGEQPDARV